MPQGQGARPQVLYAYQGPPRKLPGSSETPLQVCSLGENASCQPPTSQLGARACSARQRTLSISGDEQERDISEALSESH
jgi:hypothetical protein